VVKKVIQKIIVGVFLLGMVGAIVAGIVSLAWPSLEAHAGHGQGQGRQATLAQQAAPGGGQGQGRGGQGAGRGAGVDEAAPQGGLGRGQGSGGRGSGAGTSADAIAPQGGNQRGQGGGQIAQANEAAGRGQGRQGAGTNAVAPLGEAADWETVEGTVVETAELVVETADGQIVQVGLGQSHYREGQGFALNVGDQVRVSGYWESDEFKAAQVENLDTGASIVLRDLSGRPMWAGQGRRSTSW
jgi:hypothetical protein